MNYKEHPENSYEIQLRGNSPHSLYSNQINPQSKYFEYSTTSKNNPLHKIGFEQIVTGDINLDKNQFQRIINP